MLVKHHQCGVENSSASGRLHVVSKQKKKAENLHVTARYRTGKSEQKEKTKSRHWPIKGQTYQDPERQLLGPCSDNNK